MPKKKKENLHILFEKLQADNSLINLLAFNYKKISMMNSDELAYEYLRRNPEFILNVLRDEKKLKETKNLNHLIVDIKYFYQKKYLYNPFDIYGKYYNIEDFKLDTQLNSLENKIVDSYHYSFKKVIQENETAKSHYVNLYNTDFYITKYADIDAYKNKQQNAIPLESLTKPINTQRWLGWLRPSINLEINPYNYTFPKITQF